jgi:hypothetical protein
VSDCLFRGCVTGIGIKDGSDPIVERTRVEECETGVSSYDKNWRYPGGGRGRLVGCTLRGNEVDVRMDAESELVLESCTTEGRYRLPPKLPAGRFREAPARAGAGTERP